MTIATRFSAVCFFVLFGLGAISFGQADEAGAAVARGTAGYARGTPVTVDPSRPIQLTIGATTVLDAHTGAVVGGRGGNITASPNPNLTPGVTDLMPTLPTFTGSFIAQAGPSMGNAFPFTMIGNDPRLGGTTVMLARIDEVSLQLLNADGSVFMTVPFAPFEALTLSSPNFRRTTYPSGGPIQFADAIQRAEFFNHMGPDWHTNLAPTVVKQVTITVPFFVNVQLSNGNIVQARSYFTGTAGDGSTFVLMLSPLFNFFFDNEVVNEINLGNFTTDALNMTLFPNTFLFNLNANNPNVPGGCCTLGLHTFFQDGATPPNRWVTLFASWISPGLFGAGFQDVAFISHEISAAFNNPFLNNAAPIWQFPGQPANSHVCQNNLETGDPVEVLPNATVPITIAHKGGAAVTYHPQNLALLQWFEMGTTSDAIDGAFSFPDETVLPHSAVPCPQ